ncbi:MAG: MOFRL family protein, partial [Acidimicrobiia bacterium]
EQRGYPARVLDTRMTGDAGAMAGEALSRTGFGVSVFAGETTVTVTGDGVGGRNHEAALVAATLIDGRPDVWFLAAGTDGIDGITRAAGAVVDGGTVARGRAAGLDAGLALAHNDSGGFFAGLGEQLVTGPTGTNVGDLWMVLRV